MDWLTVALTAFAGLATLFGSVGSVAYWRLTRGNTGRTLRHEEIDSRVVAAIAPIQKDVTALHSKLDARPAEVKIAILEALEPVKEQLTTIGTRIDPLWKALEQLAINNAIVLHHPEPERAELDQLLDHFRDNVLTSDEEFALRRWLVRIKNFEKGQDIGIPVYDGEPSAAANLLAMLELVRIYRERSRA